MNKVPMNEQEEVAQIFAAMLKAATGDGGKKRAAGEKPSWKVDESHRAAIFSHLYKWQRGDVVDEDSGADPLVHLAWRALALAYQRQAKREAIQAQLKKTPAQRLDQGTMKAEFNLLQDGHYRMIYEALNDEQAPLSYKGRGHSCRLSQTECDASHAYGQAYRAGDC